MAKKIKMSNTPRKLEESSWLAQIIKDRKDAEFDKNRESPRYRCLHTLLIIVNQADDPDNHNIYYDTYNGIRSITICAIPSLVLKCGTDFDMNGMQCKLRGLAERYKDDDGQYLVSVLTTNDLNGANIKNISELMYQMSSR